MNVKNSRQYNKMWDDIYTKAKEHDAEWRKEIYSYFVNVLGYRTEIYDLFDHKSVTSLVENMKRDGEWLGFQEYRSK